MTDSKIKTNSDIKSAINEALLGMFSAYVEVWEHDSNYFNVIVEDNDLLDFEIDFRVQDIDGVFHMFDCSGKPYAPTQQEFLSGIHNRFTAFIGASLRRAERGLK